jgi:membrane peptidoglycan carboxypeptidase
VDRKNRQNGKWERVPAGDEHAQGVAAIDAKIADEVTYVLKKIPSTQGHALSGRQAASKSGTWENGKKQADGVTPVFKGQHAHAWYVGYTEQIATAIWVGSKDHNDTPIKEANGKPMFGAGLPGEMWESFMNQAHKDLQLPPKRMTDGTGGKLGDPNKGEVKADQGKHEPRPERSRGKPRNSSTPPPNAAPAYGGIAAVETRRTTA